MKTGTKILIVGLVLIFGFGGFYIAGNTIKVPYTAMVTYVEDEPYEVTVPKTVTYNVAEWGCDKRSNCRCTHERLWGILGCDECECTRTEYETETKWRKVEKQRTETRYQTLFESWGIQFISPIVIK